MTSEMWLNSFSNIISAFIGAGAALFVYFKSISHEKVSEKLFQQEKDESIIKYINLSLRETIDSVNNYIDILFTIRREINVNPIYLPDIEFLLFPFAERLVKKSDQNAIFKAINNFFPNESSNIYSNLFHSLDYIVSSMPEIHKMNDKAIEDDKQRKLLYKEFIEENLDEIAHLGLISGVKYGTTFCSDIESILLNFYTGRTSNIDLHYHQTEFVEKVRDYFFENYKSTPELLRIATQMKNATQLFYSMQQHNMHHIKFVDTYIAQFVKVRDNLDNVYFKISGGENVN